MKWWRSSKLKILITHNTRTRHTHIYIHTHKHTHLYRAGFIVLCTNSIGGDKTSWHKNYEGILFMYIIQASIMSSSQTCIRGKCHNVSRPSYLVDIMSGWICPMVLKKMKMCFVYCPLIVPTPHPWSMRYCTYCNK